MFVADSIALCGLQALVLFDRDYQLDRLRKLTKAHTHLTNTTFRILHCPDPHHLDVGRAVANMLLLVLVIVLFGGQGVADSQAV